MLFDKSDMDYPTFMANLVHMLDGIYKVGGSSYAIVLNKCAYNIGYIGVAEHIESPRLEIMQPPIVSGITEDAMLAAIAIAQDPTLATTILAMRQPSKN